MKKKYQYRPRPEQLNPDNILTDSVQYWRNGIMLTGQMRNDVAKELIGAGKAFVMCEQAIGAMDENGYSLA